jgi:hypothetical protein
MDGSERESQTVAPLVTRIAGYRVVQTLTF